MDLEEDFVDFFQVDYIGVEMDFDGFCMVGLVGFDCIVGCVLCGVVGIVDMGGNNVGMFVQQILYVLEIFIGQGDCLFSYNVFFVFVGLFDGVEDRIGN